MFITFFLQQADILVFLSIIYTFLHLKNTFVHPLLYDFIYF